MRSFKKIDIEQSIPSRFEKQVLRYPDKLAVKTTKESLTYAQLNRIANQIARVILATCATDIDSVGLFLDQGALHVAAILGTLKAGKIYVPLDPFQPGSQISEILLDATVHLILTDTLHFTHACPFETENLSVVNISKMDGDIPTENRAVTISPESLAYIFYTSGSTGRPKGVADSHRNVLHNIMRYTNSLRITPGDRLTLLQPGNFSGSVSSLFCALLNGATSFPFSLRQEGTGQLAAWVHQERITIWHSVPSIFRFIATGVYGYPFLRIIRLEGDQTTIKDLELYMKFFPDSCVLVNGLGATECGLVRQYFINKTTPLPDSVVPVGYLVEDMEVLILDEKQKTIEANHIGEIAICSRYLAPGYWRREKLTKELFLTDVRDGAKRIYRTGDLGRMTEDGCLHHLGRNNYQYKIRGRWIDIAEIETALHQMEIFEDAVVLIREDPGFDKKLVAYLSPGESVPPKIDTIRDYLSHRLPDHMIPSLFVMVESIPLNAFGKVDRSALPIPEKIRPETTQSYIAPRTLLQRQLTQIWEDLLEIHPIGIRDNFFELGGDSLLAVQIISHVRDMFKVELSLRTIFEYPSISGLAEYIDKKTKVRKSTTSDGLPAVHPRENFTF